MTAIADGTQGAAHTVLATRGLDRKRTLLEIEHAHALVAGHAPATVSKS